MTAGCCYATKVAAIQRLKALMAAEKNPDVKRGLFMAINELKRKEADE